MKPPFPRTKTCIVTRWKISTEPMPFGWVTYELMEAAFRPPARTGEGPDWMEPFARKIDAAGKYVVSSTDEYEFVVHPRLAGHGPTLLPRPGHSRRLMWVDVFGKVFFAAIVIVILVGGYLFF